MEVAIIGRTRMLLGAALALQARGHRIRAIITAPAAPEYSCSEEDFRELAATLGVPFILTDTLDAPEVEETCRGLDIGISVNWRTVVHERHLALFRLGILNAHAGDLPKYRGNACANWAIANGDDRVTTSIHFMEGGMLDCGRIVARGTLPLDDDATIADVIAWSERVVPELFARSLEALASDEGFAVRSAAPDDPEGFRCYPRLPEDGFIDWASSARDIHNLIRAAGPPFAGAYTYQLREGKVDKLIILKSRIVELSSSDRAMPGHVLRNDGGSGESWVMCGEGILGVLQARYDSETEDFRPGERWRSIRMRLGVRVEDWLYRSSAAHRASTEGDGAERTR